MLSSEQGQKLLQLARKSISSYFFGESVEEELKGYEDKVFSEKRGVFVTLNKHEELRGCIGFPYPTKPLAEAVVDAARSAAFSDPRFIPLEKEELKAIKIDISVLTEPREIRVKGQELLKEIKIGKDGLIVQFSGFSGLLLPQVATEQKWNTLEFLRACCVKAGLPPEIWLNPGCKIFKFQARIFSE